MIIEIKVPPLAESVTDATVLEWQKSAGDFVKKGEHLVDLETDKVTLEVSALDDGILKEILHQQGETVLAGEVLALIDTDAAAPETTIEILDEKAPEPEMKPNIQPAPVTQTKNTHPATSPAVRKLLAEHKLNPDTIRKALGITGRLTKTDVQTYLQQQPSIQTVTPQPEGNDTTARKERRVPMSRLRQRAAERLLQAQHENAILTTFNEINLFDIKQLRTKTRPQFEEKYGYAPGYLPFFIKAVIKALQEYPVINASVDGHDILYHDYYDIGVAVSTSRGLVVPVVRNADRLSLAAMEGMIRELAEKARDAKLTLDDLTGGTFTITNGGVFGSLLSTPILNPPQSAILGMHAIQDRPIAENGQVVIRPVMYVALSYDHRIIDGREAVSFLVSIKKQLEDPALLFMEI